MDEGKPPLQVCAKQTTKEKLNDHIQNLFDIPNKGIQDAFSLILNLLNDYQTKYEADHKRLQEESNSLLRSMKEIQETSFKIVESFQKREDLYSKFECVTVDMSQLVQNDEEIKKDQVHVRSLLSKLQHSVKRLEFQMQLDTQVVSEPLILQDDELVLERDEVLNSPTSIEIGHISLQQDLIKQKNQSNSCDERQPNITKHKFSHKAHSHKTIAGRLNLLEGSAEEMKYDLDAMKSTLQNLKDKGDEDEPMSLVENGVVNSSIKEYIRSRTMNAISDEELIHETNVDRHLSNPCVLSQDDNGNDKIQNDEKHEKSHQESFFDNEITDSGTNLNEMNIQSIGRLEARLDVAIRNVLHKINFLEKKSEELNDFSASFISLRESNEEIKYKMTDMHQNMNVLKNHIADTMTKSEVISQIEECTSKSFKELVAQKENIVSDQLEKENDEKKSSLPNDIHRELNQRDEIIHEKISSMESLLAHFDRILSDSNLKEFLKPIESSSIVHDSHDNSKEAINSLVNPNLQMDILNRLEGLKQVEEEMEKLSSKLSEIPDEIHIHKMLHDLEVSVLRHIGNDSATQSMVDDLRKELNERMTKVDVMHTVKQMIESTKKGLVHETQIMENSSIMVGYKCLSCNNFHPSGINRTLAPKVNNNSLPIGKSFTSSNGLITCCKGYQISRARPLTAESTNRLPRLTKHHSRPSTASFLTARSKKTTSTHPVIDESMNIPK